MDPRSEYGALVEAEVTTDPEALTLPELHQRAWTIVEPLFTADHQAALDTYQHLAGTADACAAHSIEEIAPAAYFQRADTLFLPQAMTLWGAFAPEENPVEIHAERQAGDQDLLDFAAVHMLLNGGKVYLVEADDLSNSAMPVAIFRYEETV